jgi:UDP-N-acetylmuramate--alanine ligase
VVEGDESDAAILAYTPFAAVVTNIDADHLDVYGSREAYAAVFDDFLDRVDPDGFLVCVLDDPGAARLAALAQHRLRVVPVGGAGSGSLRASRVELDGQSSRFDVVRADAVLGAVELQVPGPVYVSDALAALATGLELGFSFADLARGLARFRGTGRRMEFKGAVNGIRVYDSYAHHPVELAADLAAVRDGGRVLVLFQPHLYSRTRHLAREFGSVLAAADVVAVTDVYRAREEPVEGVTGKLVVDAVAEARPGLEVGWTPTVEGGASFLARRARAGDQVLTLGAGDVDRAVPLILEAIG